jgi:hypothetical protein
MCGMTLMKRTEGENSMRSIEEDGDEDEDDEMRCSLRYLVLLYPDVSQPNSTLMLPKKM